MRDKYLLKRFGITEEQYESLLQKQDGRCAVCRRRAETFKYRLCLDHDHKTGDVRGILCIHCNRFIVGRHTRERGADLLLAAYEYLTGEYPGWIVPPRVKKRKRREIKRLRKLLNVVVKKQRNV